MSAEELSDFVEATAAEFGIPGVAVGVWADGQEIYACHGVTSVDNPLPVDRHTLFVLGSVTKTYTATALMRLVAQKAGSSWTRRCVGTFPSCGSRTSGPRPRSPC